MDMPPSRYKVVEKGRRLVVVDTYTGEAVRPAPVQSEPSRPARMNPALRPPLSSGPLPGAQKAGRSRVGGPAFTTQSWYDNRAPREVQLSQDAQMGLLVGAVAAGVAMLILFATFGFPVLIIAAVLLANIRKGARSVITGWLDGMERG